MSQLDPNHGHGDPVWPQVPPPPPSVAARQRPWLIPVVIVVSILLFIGLAIGAYAAVFNLVMSSMTPAGQTLVEGTATVPRAVEPLNCPDACFDESSIGDVLLLDTDLDAAGLTRHDFPWGTYDPTTAGAVYRASVATWRAAEGSPDTCFFAPANSPAAIAIDDDEATSTDVIQFTGEHADRLTATVLDQSVRIFPSSEAAERYLAKLHAQIESCKSFSAGTGSEGQFADVTPMPDLSLPPSVAATGWVRTGQPGPRWRAYAADVQRGNLVVRIRVRTDGAMTELEYRALVERYAVQLAALETGPVLSHNDDLAAPPSSPYAVDPTFCEGSCIGMMASNLSHPSSRDFAALGLTVDAEDPAWPGSAFSQRTVDQQGWADLDGSPSSCFAVFSPFPMTGSGAAEGSSALGSLFFDGTRRNPAGTAVFTQATRLFPDSTSAVAYMVQEHTEVSQCTEFTSTVDGVTTTTSVRPAAALTVPDNVAVIGWVEHSSAGDRYVFDLQRGNLTVRSALESTGGMTEREFRDLMVTVANRVGAMRLDSM